MSLQLQEQSRQCWAGLLVALSSTHTRLKAIPQNKKDEVDLTDDSLTKEDLREQIKKLCYEKEFLTACYYCNGRDYSTKNIPAALQTKKPLDYNLIKD